MQFCFPTSKIIGLCKAQGNKSVHACYYCMWDFSHSFYVFFLSFFWEEKFLLIYIHLLISLPYNQWSHVFIQQSLCTQHPCLMSPSNLLYDRYCSRSSLQPGSWVNWLGPAWFLGLTDQSCSYIWRVAVLRPNCEPFCSTSCFSTIVVYSNLPTRSLKCQPPAMHLFFCAMWTAIRTLHFSNSDISIGPRDVVGSCRKKKYI